MTQTALDTINTVPSAAPVLDLGPRLIDTTTAPGNFVVVHTLTTMVGVNPNRDFEGLPKRLTVGGGTRLRISAQSMARAARTWSREFIAPYQRAAQSRRLPELVASRLVSDYGYDAAQAGFAAAAIVSATKMGINWEKPGLTTAVMYLPADTAVRFAKLVHDNWDALADARKAVEDKVNAHLAKASGRGKKKTVKKAAPVEAELTLTEVPVEDAGTGNTDVAADTKDAKEDTDAIKLPPELAKKAKALYDPLSNIELCSWGRMLANIPELNLESATQVAHLFGVDPFREEVDDFTVVDDWQGDEHFGSANQGHHRLASGTLYGYAALDRKVLRDNLRLGAADEADIEALAHLAEQVFVAAMFWATPSGKRTRTGSTALPTLGIAATVDMPTTAAAAFETPMPSPAGVTAAHRLMTYLRGTQRVAPFHSGLVWWLSPDGSAAPALPTDRLQLLS